MSKLLPALPSLSGYTLYLARKGRVIFRPRHFFYPLDLPGFFIL